MSRAKGLDALNEAAHRLSVTSSNVKSELTEIGHAISVVTGNDGIAARFHDLIRDVEQSSREVRAAYGAFISKSD